MNRFFAVFFALFFSCINANAITIDKLEADQQVTATGAVPSATQIISASPSSVIGGVRQIDVQKSTGSVILSNIQIGVLSHSQNASTRGASNYIWDGNPLPGVQASGLGGVNLLADGATAFRVTVSEFDFPGNQPIFLNFTVYDASDSTGTVKLSKGILPIDAAVTNERIFEIPFSTFQVAGTEATSFTNVGAISLFIDGTASPAHDLDISFVGTNGRCTQVPVNRLVVDLCGVCAGDNSTCSDCEGVPNGTKVAGVGCSTGRFGVCSAGVYTGKFPSCGCQQSSQPSVELCDNIDNNCTGEVDEGLGKGTACNVGVGACFRTGSRICAADKSVTCSASAGTPIEEICDGIDNDCDGQIDEGAPKTGPRIDQCGVCGGNGSSCKDCTGVVNGVAVLDACGVCKGDGTSCCTKEDQSGKLQAMDVGAKEQEMVVRNASAILRTLGSSNQQRSQARSTLALVHTLQIRNWTLSWTVPAVTSNCPGVNVCVKANNTPILSEYRANNKKLHELASVVLLQVKDALGKTSLAGRKKTTMQNRYLGLVRWNDRLVVENEKISLTVPEVQSVCG